MLNIQQHVGVARTRGRYPARLVRVDHAPGRASEDVPRRQGSYPARWSIDPAQPCPVVLDRAAAPCAVRSMVHLAHQKYYDGTTCHRLTAYHTAPYALSVLQCGDPLGTGWGDPGYWFKDELGSANALPNWPGFPDGSRKNYTRGTLAMANGGPDTNGSQFFLVYDDSRLSPDYTVFGHVTPAGMKVLNKIAGGGVDPGTDGTPEDGAPALTTIIERAKSGV